MNSKAPFLASAVIAAVVSFAVVQFAGGGGGDTPDSTGPGSAQAAAGMRAEIEDLRAEVERLVAAQRERVTNDGPERAAVEIDLDARIDEALARAVESGALAVEAGAAAPSTLNVDAIVAELRDGEVNPNLNSAAWKRIEEAGKVDEVIAAFERIAEENPGDANAQAQYGEALLAKLMNANGVMESAKYSGMADRAWDKALAIDSTHWSARFNKAVSYTFYPAFTGKPAEAVTHFETLMDQQEQRPKPGHGGHVETYLMLGNMHKSQGNLDKANEVWRRGLQFHPGNERLQANLGR